VLLEARVTVRASSPLEAKAVYEALKVEAQSQPTSRVKMEVSWDGEEVHVTLMSDKRAALRAALNSLFRILSALENTGNALTDAPRLEK